jgi:oligopeptide transport system permease protein
MMAPAAEKAINGLGGQRPLPPALAESIRQQHHLDENFFVQYWYFIKGVFTFDLGNNFAGRSIASDIAQAFPTTVKLALYALVLEAVFGIVVGVIAGMRKGKLFDSTFLVISLVLIAVPTFVTGYLAQFFFGVKLGWFPGTVGSDVSLYSLTLPAIILATVSFAYIVRLTRTTVSENLSADFVRTARAKGLQSGAVTRNHIVRNSLIPVVTFLGTDLGALMGGAIVTEGIFNVNGIGNLLYKSITAGEVIEVVTIVAILVIVFLVANLLVDLLYAVLDPRIRYA